MKMNLIVFAFILVLDSCTSGGNEKDAAVTAIAKAHGLDAFEKIKTIEFTFNVQRDTSHTARHWKWERETNRITSTENGKNTSFQRYDTSTAELKQLNAKFTNDEYWLLFPLHLQWDNGYTLSISDTATSPLSGNKLAKCTVKYNDTDGFTPGDMYELYIDEKHIVREWAFHKKASPEPSLITTWEDYQDFSGVQIAKEHKTKDGKFRLYFTDLRIQ